ncbi:MULTISPECIES: hypothetical protein [unclassified Spirosoma]|uniref:hypothetical protein n=1 Tax=unclassified Spirosoma TaxID=2621999 RepID=UPI00095A46BB|nr:MULTISPECIES: hypothetical protein [unclassified Spirosoma]MBN8823344.1 hypothetical protein [Spirosoma sp.]OJW72518.1 MAG: hypothetical protein BGO59_15445 [Spirosoma sp. 48-14]
MYFPTSNPLVLVNEDQGIWAPADHQRIIAKLTTGLGVLYYHQKRISFEPLPETMLDDTKASPVPDLSLVDTTTDETPIIIEVCKTNGQKGDIAKVIQLIDDDLYGIREGFIYNYKTQQWYRYRFGDGGFIAESSFSEILQLDLNTFL